jgi:hypothetical protein
MEVISERRIQETYFYSMNILLYQVQSLLGCTAVWTDGGEVHAASIIKAALKRRSTSI